MSHHQRRRSSAEKVTAVILHLQAQREKIQRDLDRGKPLKQIVDKFGVTGHVIKKLLTELGFTFVTVPRGVRKPAKASAPQNEQITRILALLEKICVSLDIHVDQPPQAKEVVLELA